MVMENEYEGRCKMRVYDSISDWKKSIQSDKPIDPMTHIEDLCLRCDFDRDYIGSILKINIRIRNLLEEKIPMKIKMYLYEDIDQASIGAMDIRMVAQGRTTTKGYFELPINTIKLWSDQEPNLYEVLVVMTDHFDEPLQIVGFQYGFREIKIRGSQIWINNKPLMLKGINYHGNLKKDINETAYSKDLMLLKQYNINALKVDSDRVDYRFYECCDQLGFFVVAEVNGSENNKESIIAKATSVIGTKRNHPCIMMWSLESTLNKKENLAVKKTMIALDDRRPYLIYGEEDFQLSDVFVMEKLHEKTIERIGKGLDIREDMLLLEDSRFTKSMDEYAAMAYKKKPAILCTNRQIEDKELINSRRVMDSMHAYIRWHGGFIGNFVNYFGKNSISEVKSDEIKPLAYEIKKAFEPYAISFDSQTAFYSIKNFNTISEDIEVRVTIQEDGTPIIKEYLNPINIGQGEVASGAIKSWLQLKNEAVLYHIIFEVLLTEDLWWAKKGHVLASEQFEKEGYLPVIYMPKSTVDCTINESNETIEVVGEKTRYEFDKKTGHILLMRVDHKDLLAQPIRPIWRSIIESEAGSDGGIDTSYGQVKAYRVEKKGALVEICFDIKIKAIKTLLLIRYEIFSTGELNVYYEGEPMDKSDILGSTITLAAQKNQVNWFGRGPHPCCFKDMTSIQMGLYQMDLLEINRGDHGCLERDIYKDIRWITLIGSDGEGVMLESMDKNGFDAGLASLDQETTTLHIYAGKMDTVEGSALEAVKHTCSYRFLFLEAL